MFLEEISGLEKKSFERAVMLLRYLFCLPTCFKSDDAKYLFFVITRYTSGTHTLIHLAKVSFG